MWFFAPILQAYVGLQDLSLETISDYYDSRQGTTGDLEEGAGAFKAPSFSDPLFVPKSFLTVLFRPFLWEAHNFQALIQALDGVLLLGLMSWRAPSLGKAILRFRSEPYVIFIIAYVSMLVFALMTIANFGTLARERVMLLPLLLMLPAYQPRSKSEKASN